jgi:hypothetical protein
MIQVLNPKYQNDNMLPCDGCGMVGGVDAYKRLIMEASFTKRWALCPSCARSLSLRLTAVLSEVSSPSTPGTQPVR